MVADFDALLTGPLDASLRSFTQRLRDAFASITLSPPPQPLPANSKPVSMIGESDDEVPTKDNELPEPSPASSASNS